MEDCLKIFNKFLHNSLLHNTIIILGLLANHDGGLAFSTE